MFAYDPNKWRGNAQFFFLLVAVVVLTVLRHTTTTTTTTKTSKGTRRCLAGLVPGIHNTQRFRRGRRE